MPTTATTNNKPALTILYGSQTGYAERLSLTIARCALKRGATSVRVLPADDVPAESWPSLPGPLIIVCSNANQGDAPDSFRRTWARLLDASSPVSLNGLCYAVFGLGDSSYMRFNYMAMMIHNKLRLLGGQPLLQRGLGDESDAMGIEEILLPWLMKLWVALEYMMEDEPAMQKSETILDLQPTPVWKVEEMAECSTEVLGFASSSNNNNTSSSSPPRLEDVFAVEVSHTHRLTAEEHFQRVQHVEMVAADPIRRASCSTSYDVGDALGIFCPNHAEQVEQLLQLLHRRGEELICITPNHDDGITAHTARPFFGRPMTLRYFLTHYVDLEAVVSQEWFWMMARCTPSPGMPLDEEVLERLLELADPLRSADYLNYAHREKRNVVEVLHDFQHTHPLPQDLAVILCHLPLMRPRLFSISSSPRMDDRYHLSIAELAWTTPLKRNRRGLCSSVMCAAEVGHRFSVFVWRGTLTLPSASPQDESSSPLMCVATGTGIAPIRSALRECAAVGGAWRSTPMMIVLGFRNKMMDFLYAEEWAELQQQLPKMELVVAFSRDTEKKIYVQHQLGQHATRVAALLRDDAETPPAVVLVCGNSKQMPKDVQNTITSIVAACICDGDEVAAERFVKTLHRCGRLQMDTWSA